MERFVCIHTTYRMCLFLKTQNQTFLRVHKNSRNMSRPQSEQPNKYKEEQAKIKIHNKMLYLSYPKNSKRGCILVKKEKEN